MYSLGQYCLCTVIHCNTAQVSRSVSTLTSPYKGYGYWPIRHTPIQDGSLHDTHRCSALCALEFILILIQAYTLHTRKLIWSNGEDKRTMFSALNAQSSAYRHRPKILRRNTVVKDSMDYLHACRVGVSFHPEQRRDSISQLTGNRPSISNRKAHYAW